MSNTKAQQESQMNRVAMMVSRFRAERGDSGFTTRTVLAVHPCCRAIRFHWKRLGTAQIEGIPDARFWGDVVSPHLKYEMDNLTPEEIRTGFPSLYGQPHNYLAISGGGANGAFGARCTGGMERHG